MVSIANQHGGQMTKTGKLLKRARTEAGLSQLDMSRKMGLSTPQYISNVELGKVGLAVGRLRQVAKLTKTPIDEFIQASTQDHEAKVRRAVERA